MHRRTALYGPDASEFNPSRWENGTLEKKLGYGFLAFHGGPRICLGSEYALIFKKRLGLITTTEDFALTEASYGIVRIAQTFPGLRLPPDIVKEETGQEKQSLTIVVSSAEGCKVLLR
jgi:hypothetical protein